MRVVLFLTALAAVACGDKKPATTAAPVSEDGGTAVASAVPLLGVDAVTRFNYPYEKAAKDHERAVAAHKAKPPDWPSVKSASEATLTKDPSHLDAHYLLGAALAQSTAPGDQDAAANHLATALAGDWFRWGPGLATSPDLAAFLKSPAGGKLLALNEAMRRELEPRVTGPLVLGRRTTYKAPSKEGAQWASTRGEIYALDLPGRRFVRLTHTDHTVAAFLRSPSGGEVVVLGFDKVEVAAAATPAPPQLARAWVETFDAKTWQSTSKRTSLPRARKVSASYGVGEQLVVATYPGEDGAATTATTYSLDRTTGKLAKTAATVDNRRAVIAADGALVDLAAPGVEATWEGDPAITSRLKLGATTIDIPESGKAARHGIAVSPGGKRLAFVTEVDPCAKQAALPSLYVADAATGQLRHVLTAASRFGVLWLDDERFLYEDDSRGLRLYDAFAGREQLRLESKAGLAVRSLSPPGVQVCPTAPAPPPPPPTDTEPAGEADGPATLPAN